MFHDDIAKLQKNMELELELEDYPVNGPNPTHSIRKLGVVTVGNVSYLISADYSWIFANNKVILSTFNDSLTAIPVTVAMLQAFYGDAFVPAT